MARGFHHAPGTDVQMHQAQDPGLTKSELLPLGSSRSAAVREVVASRQDCPLGLMVSLAHDYHVDVRCAIAGNPSAQRSVLAYLAADRHVEVVLAVVSNPSLPPDVLDELAFHRRAVIKRAAAERLNAGTDRSRQEQERRTAFEDARVPEVAEKYVPPLHTTDSRVEQDPPARYTFVPDEGGDPSAPAQGAPMPGGSSERPTAVDPVVADPQRSAPRFTRTAPVRGFRPPPERHQ